MRYALIENGLVTNVIEADAVFMAGMVADDGAAQIGGTWDGIKFGPPVIPLADAKSAQIAALYAAYLADCSANVPYLNTTFQADDRSVKLLQGAVTSYTLVGSVPAGFYWRDANNVNIPMTLAQLQGLGAAVTSQVWAAFQRMQDRKAQVLAATDVATV
jgi:hypothetical protein